jgi:ribosome recycling factor
MKARWCTPEEPPEDEENCMTIAEIKKTTETKMDQSIAAFKNNLTKIRTGRANPALLDTVQVEYYGSMVPLSQVANVSLLDSRTISVQPWEKGMGAKIEKAIRESDLGLNPASMGDLIRVPMPPMSEERRKEMTKLVRHEGENAKIAVRNLRRDANEAVKKLVKDKLASEDDQKRAEPTSRRSPTGTSPRSISWSRPKSRKSWRSDGLFFLMSAPNAIPHHIAIVMDGNGRWATRRYLPRVAGHVRVSIAAALRAGLFGSRCARADGVRVFLRELEPPPRGGLRPDGTAGHGAGRARCRSSSTTGCASISSVTVRPVDKVRKAWRRPRPRRPTTRA